MMNMKQERLDISEGVFKNEPDLISGQTKQRYKDLDDDVFFEEFETNTPGQNVEIKEEIIECEGLKIEQRSDLLPKMNSDSTSVGFCATTIKKELDNTTDIRNIKEDISEYFQSKVELLTTHCDLPTLKNENTELQENLTESCGREEKERISNTLKNDANVINNVEKRRKQYLCKKNKSNTSQASKIRKKSSWSKKKKELLDLELALQLEDIVDEFESNESGSAVHESDHPNMEEWIGGKNHWRVFRSPRKNLLNGPFGKCYDTCYYCAQFFLTKSQFLYHFFVFHYVKKVTKVYNPKFGQYKICRCNNFLHTLFRNPSTPNIFHSNRKLFRCEICSKQFIEKGYLNRHLRIHTGEKPFKCEICSRQFSEKGYLNKHLRIHTGEKLFKCEICSKQFIEKGHFNNHLRIHTGEKPFKCELCSKQFTHKGSLNYHLKIHTGKKQFQCEICSKRFFMKSDLNDHLYTHNTEEKPFKCEICSKQFVRKYQFNVHLRTHTGEKPFKCEICSKQFIQNCDLNDHLYTHNAEEKPFKCEICSKQFVRKYQFNVHLRTHTGEKPFKCEICSKQFIDKGNLNHHLKIHTGEKPFKCEICLKQFTQKSNLKMHVQIHKKEKTFECEICCKQFLYKGNLKKHLKIHTGEKS